MNNFDGRRRRDRSGIDDPKFPADEDRTEKHKVWVNPDKIPKVQSPSPTSKPPPVAPASRRPITFSPPPKQTAPSAPAPMVGAPEPRQKAEPSFWESHGGTVAAVGAVLVLAGASIGGLVLYSMTAAAGGPPVPPGPPLPAWNNIHNPPGGGYGYDQMMHNQPGVTAGPNGWTWFDPQQAAGGW